MQAGITKGQTQELLYTSRGAAIRGKQHFQPLATAAATKAPGRTLTQAAHGGTCTHAWHRQPAHNTYTEHDACVTETLFSLFFFRVRGTRRIRSPNATQK